MNDTGDMDSTDHGASERIAVVGGAGFLGSHLVDRLLAEGADVDVIDDLSTGSLANLSDARIAAKDGPGHLTIHNMDAAAPETSTLFGMRRPSVVYLLATMPDHRGVPAVAAASFERALLVLDAVRAHALPKVVAVVPGTVVYGVPAARDLPVKERPLEPRGVRGVVARSILDLLDVYRSEHAVEFTALAMGSVYGPRQRADRGVVASFAAALANGGAPLMTGDGRQTRDLLFVDDAVDAMVRAGRRGSGLVVNVGTGVQTSIRDLWTAMAGPGRPAPSFVAARPDELQRFALSPVRARIHLGWSPWTTLAEGLEQTVRPL